MITQTDSLKKNIHSSLYKSASISNDLSKISQIHEDEINISIWRRILSNSTIKASEYTLNNNPLLEFSEVLQPENVRKSLKSSIGSNEKMLPFFEDVSNLVSMFCELFNQILIRRTQ